MNTSITSFLMALVMSINVFAATQINSNQTHQNITSVSKQLFYTKQLKMLQDEYSEWKFKEVTLLTLAAAKGWSQFLDYTHIPTVVAVGGSTFFFTWKAIWNSLTSGGGCSCGCYFFEFVGATIGAAAATGVSVGITHGIRSLYEIWYEYNYARYYGHIRDMSQEQLAEEALNIQGALRDLEDKILTTEKNLNLSKAGAN